MRQIAVMTLLVAVTVPARSWAGDEAPGPAIPRYEGRTTAEWAGQLASEDVSARKKAAYALWRLGPDAGEAALALVKAIRDTDAYVRGTAAKAVQRLDPNAVKPVLPELSAELADERQEVRREAATLFWRLGPLAAEAVPALTKALGSADPVVRANAAASLGNAGDAAKPALETLKKLFADGDEAVRIWAGKAVAGIDPAAAFASERAEIRLAALRFWGDNPPAKAWTRPEVVVGVLKAIDDPNEEIRGSATHALDTFAAFAGRDRPVAWIPIFRRILEKERAPAVQATGAFGLGRYTGHGPEVVPALTEAAKGDEPEVKRAAVLALGWLKEESRSAVPVVLDAIRSDNEELRAAAAVALGGIGDTSEAVVDALIGLIRRGEGFTPRNAIASLSLVGKGSPRVAEALVGVVKDDGLDIFVRGEAAGALATVGGGKDVIATLTSYFENDPEAPAQVAYALCALDSPLASKALGRLAGVAKDPKNPYLALSLLRRLGPKAAGSVPAVVEVLAATDKGLRITAAGVLEAIGPAASGALSALELASKDRDPEVSAAAKAAMDKIRVQTEPPKQLPGARGGVPTYFRICTPVAAEWRRARSPREPRGCGSDRIGGP